MINLLKTSKNLHEVHLGPEHLLVIVLELLQDLRRMQMLLMINLEKEKGGKSNDNAVLNESPLGSALSKEIRRVSITLITRSRLYLIDHYCRSKKVYTPE